MQGRADITVTAAGYARVNHAEQHDTLHFSLTIRFQERKPAFFLVSQCKEIKSDFQVTDEGKISLQLAFFLNARKSQVFFERLMKVNQPSLFCQCKSCDTWLPLTANVTIAKETCISIPF